MSDVYYASHFGGPMTKQDKAFDIALIVALVLAAIIVAGSQFVAENHAYTRLENPATYHG